MGVAARHPEGGQDRRMPPPLYECTDTVPQQLKAVEELLKAALAADSTDAVAHIIGVLKYAAASHTQH